MFSAACDLLKHATREEKLPPTVWLTVPLDAIARACCRATAFSRLTIYTDVQFVRTPISVIWLA